MPFKKYLTVFLLSASLSTGCVSTVPDPLFSNSGPIIDRKGVDLNLYALDLKQCSEYADQVSVGRSVIKGAAAGAAIGGLYEVVTREEEAVELGAVTGGIKSAIASMNQKEKIVKKCLIGRGYRVLS
tara:strand:+ start:1318 stop:1698 length:381 start_codon:yes stop_codon:yes gene_type:complete